VAGGTGGAGGSTKACSAPSSGCKIQLPEGCGDGINNQNGIEQCDDHNVLAGDGCNGACKVEPNWACPPAGACTRKVICGDGVIGPGEVCDDGNARYNDGCNATCTVQDPAFRCIAGQLCNRISQCGNERIEAGEVCDDGNTTSGDGCDSSCQLEPGWVCPAPGNACKQAPNGCPANCKPGGCGDGIVNGAETCDDGVNDGTYGTCSPDCTLAPSCGDGVVQPDYGEECEPIMPNDPSCTNVCRMPGGCGDGIVEPPEQCDDGEFFNNGDYGGCAPSCIYAPHCGDGVKNGPEQCDDGILDGSYGGCTPQCTPAPHCGDGIVNGPEECDHGAQNGQDGDCTAWCKTIVYIPS
jgi:cysteine-rich repeat protein